MTGQMQNPGFYRQEPGVLLEKRVYPEANDRGGLYPKAPKWAKINNRLLFDESRGAAILPEPLGGELVKWKSMI